MFLSSEGSGRALRFDTDRRIDRSAIAISALQPFDPLKLLSTSGDA
jgi:hypothetical protein